MRIATCNILHGLDIRTGTTDLDATVAAISALDADVIALQEIDRALPRSGSLDQTAVIADALGFDGRFAPALLGNPDVAWTPVGARDPGGAAYGVAIVSRHPIRSMHTRALPGGGSGSRTPGAGSRNPGWDREPRVALTVEVDTPGGALRVTTAHASYLPWRGLAQTWAAAAAAAPVGPDPGAAVLLGDFNLPAWAVGAALRAGWRHAGGPKTYPAWEPRMAVDQILVRGDIEVTAVAAGPAGPSDHLPLVADCTHPAA